MSSINFRFNYSRFILTLLLGIVNSLYTQTYNRPVPPALFEYLYTTNEPVSGYLLNAPFKIGTGPAHPLYKSPCPTILDSNGYIFWFLDNNAASNTDFKYYPEDSTFSYTRSEAGNAYYHILDRQFNQIHMFSNVNGVEGDIHDCQKLTNGNYLIGGIKDSIMDLSSFTFNGMPGNSNTNVEAAVLQEFDETGTLVFEWNSLHFIHPTECIDSIYGYNSSNFDYCHFNAVEEDTDGHLLISFRHLDAVYKINHITGDVIWILGGKSNEFTFINDIGFSGQHDIRRLSNGNISLFDNANSSPLPRVSRGVEYSMDTTLMTVTKSWEYVYDIPFFARAMGNHTTTTHQDHLINYGLVYRPNPNMVITDNTGNILTEMYYNDSVMNYRVHIANIPFEFSQPEIDCYNSGSAITLFAPSGYTNYVWSTGETSESIVINDTGTYQVWFNFGVGMLGSKPIKINNLTTNCITGIENEIAYTTEINEGDYDLFGRKVEYPVPGGLYIRIHSDGKKTIFIYPK